MERDVEKKERDEERGRKRDTEKKRKIDSEKKKREYMASEQYLLPRKNIAGCLPLITVQDFFV